MKKQNYVQPTFVVTDVLCDVIMASGLGTGENYGDYNAFAKGGI